MGPYVEIARCEVRRCGGARAEKQATAEEYLYELTRCIGVHAIRCRRLYGDQLESVTVKAMDVSCD